MPKTDYFWTDVGQAMDRILNTVVLYDNRPCLIDEILEHDDKPKAYIRFCATNDRQRKELSSPKFEKFRNLPSLGFVNLVNRGQLVLLQRAVVSTRRHGLNGDNVSVKGIINLADETRVPVFSSGGGRGSGFTPDIYHDPGFVNTHEKKFPSLDAVLQKLNASAAMAFDSSYAVLRDAVGVRWLFRNEQRVGFFADADTLILFTKYSYLREEITSNIRFTIKVIKEY